MATPAVVVNAYRRPEALRRLLDSVGAAAYPAGRPVPLVFSIDGGPGRSAEVLRIAESFEWTAGPKLVEPHPRHLGLVGNFQFCGELTATYGAIAYLEEDLSVSPAFYAYASQALDRFGPDDRIALVSLYALWFNGYTHEPFVPLEDGADVFFVGVPYHQGLAFTRGQWEAVAPAIAGTRPLRPQRDLHNSFLALGSDEWFGRAAAHCAATGRYVVYPRVSLATGWGDVGTHFRRPSRFMQVPLEGARSSWRFHDLDDAAAVYDGFFEIRPAVLRRLAPALPDLDFDVDLYATKRRRNLHHAHVLTSRPARRAIDRFGRVMWPAEANVIHALPGDEISLTCVASVDWSRWGDLRARIGTRQYFARGRRRGRGRLALASALIDAVDGLLRLVRRRS